MAANKTRSAVWIVTACVALVAAVAAIVVFVQDRSSHPAQTHALSMNGKQVDLDPGVTPVPASVSHAVADTGARLVVPSVRLDVPLGALNEVNHEVTPPGFTSAYWVRNLGTSVRSGSRGTVYVVMHALRKGAIGPGNYLANERTGASTLRKGARVVVSGASYTVTGWAKIAKNQLANDKAVWSNTPGRLVLITCLEHPDGSPSTDNLIINASRTS